MVAMSTLRILATSSPSLYQPRRVQHAVGMGAFPTLRVVASPSPALPHARRLPYAGEIGAIAAIRVVAPASPAVARPQRFPTTVVLFAGSRYAAAASPGLQAHCLPPRQADPTGDLRKEEFPESPTTPGKPWWGQKIGNFSSKDTKHPVFHLLAVLVLSAIKGAEFQDFVKWAAARFKLPQRVTLGILIGAAAITVLFDAAVMGKDINEVCSYLSTYEPKVQEADPRKPASTSE